MIAAILIGLAVVAAPGDDAHAAAAAAVRHALDLQLKDYPNARFTEVVLWSDDNSFSFQYCGLVNAPNGYGGKSGWRHFAASVAVARGQALGKARIGLEPEKAIEYGDGATKEEQVNDMLNYVELSMCETAPKRAGIHLVPGDHAAEIAFKP